MVKITLDAETFKALASSTRLTVLRALDERRKTLTELARDLDLNKATIHEHLQLLSAAELIRKRDDEGRKWIYYELTWRGQRLLHPQETTTFNVLLGLSVLAAGGGAAMLGRAMGWWLQSQPSSAPEPGPEAFSGPALGVADDGDTANTQSGTQPPSQEGTAASPAPMPRDSAALKDTEPQAPADDSFFDDGGTLGLVLMVMMLLFTSLAVFLRRKVRPGRFNAASAAAAEGASGTTGPSLRP